jgi:hypothetical protein
MFLWWLGFVGFAWYLLVPFQWKAEAGIISNVTWPFSRSAPGVVEQIVEEPILRWGGMNLLHLRPNTIEEMIVGIVLQHPETWFTWYYSPLNMHHWAVAMLYFTPALGMTLLTHHLAWRRQH